jgi:hypothetical protein
MSDPELHRDLGMDLTGPDDLKKHPELVTNLVTGIYDEFHAYDDIDDDDEFGFDLSDDEPLGLPFAVGELAAMDERELMDIITSSDDLLPLVVVMESAGRGDAMVQLLRQHLEDESHCADDADQGDWWALLHAIFILGLMPGEKAAETLLLAFRMVTFDENNDLSDWLSPYWPTLCRGKSEFTTALSGRLRRTGTSAGTPEARPSTACWPRRRIRAAMRSMRPLTGWQQCAATPPTLPIFASSQATACWTFRESGTVRSWRPWWISSSQEP